MGPGDQLHLIWSLNHATPDTDDMTGCLRQRLKSLIPCVSILNLQVRFKVGHNHIEKVHSYGDVEPCPSSHLIGRHCVM
jgi:hypothetical protein